MKLECHKLPSALPFNFNFRRYNTARKEARTRVEENDRRVTAEKEIERLAAADAALEEEEERRRAAFDADVGRLSGLVGFRPQTLNPKP